MFVYHYYRRYAPGTDTYESLPELLMRAWVDIEYNYAHPFCVTVDDRDIMDEEDLFDTAWANAPHEYSDLAPYVVTAAAPYLHA